MGKIVVSEFVSLDGVMEAPGGEPGYKHSGWVARYQDEKLVQYKLDEVLKHEALLLGRRTYESFAAAWPKRDGQFADKMNTMQKYIASTTLHGPEWNNSTVLQGDALMEASQLKANLKGDMLVVGSRTLVNGLKQNNLVDEFRLMVFPIVLGSGMRLFEETEDAAPLKQVDTQTFNNGIVVLTYERA